VSSEDAELVPPDPEVAQELEAIEQVVAAEAERREEPSEPE
jgi:hypothetical protein